MPVTVSFGAPMSNDTLPADVRVEVERLSEVAAQLRADELKPLHVAFVRRVRRAPWRQCLADTQGKKLSRGASLAGAVVMARRLRGPWAEQERVGVMLPPSIAGALVAFAASLSGKTAVALIFTVGRAAMESAARQSGLRTVVTSRAFVERLDDEVLQALAGVELVYLEDLMQGVGTFERLGGLLRGLLLPMGMLERACGASRRVRSDDVASILFSSGSTGEPKGIELTHTNLQANCDAIAQVVPFSRRDKLVELLIDSGEGVNTKVPAAASRWLPRTTEAMPMLSRICRPKNGKQPQNTPAARPRARCAGVPSWAQSQLKPRLTRSRLACSNRCMGREQTFRTGGS